MNNRDWRVFEQLRPCLGVPIYDSRGQQVQPGHSIVLAFGCAISDFTLTSDPQRVFQCVMCLAFVQADLGTALHVGVEQPFDDEQGSLDTSDFP